MPLSVADLNINIFRDKASIFHWGFVFTHFLAKILLHHLILVHILFILTECDSSKYAENIPPENIRKPKVVEDTTGMKLINTHKVKNITRK